MMKTGRLRVLAMVMAGTLAAALVVVVLAEEPAEAAFPGTNDKIAFYSDRTGNDEVLHMYPDGKRQTNLTGSSADDYGPAYSADGKKIVFTTNRDGNHEIYRMTSTGTLQTRLTKNPAADVEPA